MRALTKGVGPYQTPFFGRRREKVALSEEIRRGSRLLTITGPSGIGKTRLAHQLIESGEVGFDPEAMWFVSLTGCRSAGDLQTAIGDALGTPALEGRALAQAIANRGRTFFVLDNYEDVAKEAAPLLASLLEACEELQILVTSLVPTGLETEILFELGRLDARDAIELYLERAHRAWANRSFSAEEEEDVEALVSRLDESPLAIELAAARVRILPPRLLLERIEEDRFSLLQSERSDRHGSLLRALSLTWEFLSPREQQVLAQSTVFVGGFTLEAAEAILASAEERRELLQILDDLGRKALLQLDDSNPPRFSLYESVRSFGAQVLDEAGMRDELHLRHGRFFAQSGERWARELDGPDAGRAMRWLSSERKNLVAALERGVERWPDLAARAGIAVLRLYVLEGSAEAAGPLYIRTVEAANATEDPVLIVGALRSRAIWLGVQGDPWEALEVLEAGLALAREASDRELEAKQLLVSGWLRARVDIRRSAMARVRPNEEAGSDALHMRWRTDLLSEASRDLEQALELGRSIGSTLIQATALRDLGLVEERRAQVDQALPLLQEAVGIARRGGHLALEARALHLQAVCLLQLARLREASLADQDALAIHRQMDDVAAIAEALGNLGAIELAAGNLDVAEGYIAEGMEAQRRLGNPQYEAFYLANLGIMSTERGDLELAEQRLLRAVGLLQTYGAEIRSWAEILVFLSISEVFLGKLELGKQRLARASVVFADLKDENGLALVEIVETAIEFAEAQRRGAAPSPRAIAALGADIGALQQRSDALATASRILRKLTGRTHERSSPRSATELSGPWADAGAEEELPLLMVGPEAGWFSWSGGPRVDMRARAAGPRLLDALVELRLERPGVGIGQEELFEIGWPGENIHPTAAASRVYGTIRVLRSIGLGPALLRHASGYLLDPQLRIVRAD